MFQYWMRENPAVVARWVNEVQQALSSKSTMAQVKPHSMAFLGGNVFFS